MREKIKGILYATAKEDYGKVAAAIEIAIREDFDIFPKREGIAKARVLETLDEIRNTLKQSTSYSSEDLYVFKSLLRYEKELKGEA